MRSYDRENEFDRSKYDVFKMLISSRDNHNLAKGTFDIPGVSDWKMRGAGIPWFGFSVEGVEAKGRPRKASFMVAEHHHVLIAVAKSETGRRVSSSISTSCRACRPWISARSAISGSTR